MKNPKIMTTLAILGLTAGFSHQAQAKNVSVVIDRGALTIQVGGTDATELSMQPKGDCSDKVTISESGDQINAVTTDDKCPSGPKLLLKVAAGDDVSVNLANGMITVQNPDKVLSSINSIEAKVQAGMIQSSLSKIWIKRVNYAGAEAKFKAKRADTKRASLNLVLTNGLIQL